jgi:Tfp pilus assembly pilus retraction ATPase PilT
LITPLDNVPVDELLDKTLQAGCRDLRLRAGQPLLTRSCPGKTEGDLLPYDLPSPLDIQQMVYAVMTDEQIRQFEREGDLSFSHPLARRALFAVHIVRGKAGVEADFLAASS